MEPAVTASADKNMNGFIGTDSVLVLAHRTHLVFLLFAKYSLPGENKARNTSSVNTES